MVRRAQSAMEYLTTYGWAILIIAIVIGVLFQLGIFNPNTFAPKGQTGACQVFRPNGPGSVSLMELTGICNGELPQSVASLPGATFSTFNGAINFPNNALYTSMTTGTIALWFKDTSGIAPNAANVLYQKPGDSFLNAMYSLSNGALDFRVASSGTVYSITAPASAWSNGGWHFIVGTYDGNIQSLYVDGVLMSSNTVGVTISSNAGPHTFFMSGDMPQDIGNIQVYNTSFTSNEVTQLYFEGIGGSPTVLQNLVSWWPLNGNANDYGGNNNNGFTNNVFYTTSWTGGYTTP